MDCSLPVPLSMGFSRQEYWSGIPLPSPEDLPDPKSYQCYHAQNAIIREADLLPRAWPYQPWAWPSSSLVPVWARAGELKQGVWAALCQKSREPLILTVLQPPTQGMGSGWREGRMPRPHETSIWDTAQKALRWRVILEQDDQNLWRWSQLICRYNTLSRTIPMHTSIGKALRTDAGDLFTHHHPPHLPKNGKA